jgi:hypothetical protein
MKIKIQIVIESENGNPEVVQEVAQLKREALRVEEFGLTLSEAKSVLQGLQQSMVEQQSAEYLAQQGCWKVSELRALGRMRLQVRYSELPPLPDDLPSLPVPPCANAGSHHGSWLSTVSLW